MSDVSVHGIPFEFDEAAPNDGHCYPLHGSCSRPSGHKGRHHAADGWWCPECKILAIGNRYPRGCFGDRSCLSPIPYFRPIRKGETKPWADIPEPDTIMVDAQGNRFSGW